MRRVEPFQPEHIQGFTLCAQQRGDFGGRAEATAIALAQAGSAFTLRGPDGTVLLVAGVARVSDGFGHCWALQSEHSGPHMRWLTARVREYLDTAMARHRRLELFARCGFGQACKWARWLGFTSEGVMQAIAHDGADMERFARINREWRA